MILESKSFKVQSIINLADKLENEDEIVALSIDNSGVNALIVHSPPDYDSESENGVFSIIKSDKPKDYTFIRFDLKGYELFRTVIKEEYYNFHCVNFLPTNEILLTCARCRYKSANEIDKNARIYSRKGELSRDFVAGDGINNVQIDIDGNIWISYFDEGIFGNFGWNEPLGAPGLICWNKDGSKIWEFEPIDELNYMADCYAMNIDSNNNIWFYYYTEFPLVKLDNAKQMKFWDTGIKGSSSLNISENNILMADGYDENNFIFLAVKENKLEKVKKIKFKDEEGNALDKRSYIPSAGSNISFFSQHKIYFTTMDQIK